MIKNIVTRIICMLAVVAILTGCKAKKELVPPAIEIPKVMVLETVPDLSLKNKLDAVNGMNTVFKTLSIKAKADLNINNLSNDVNMNIRIRNNEAIWVSVTAVAGLEVARALITADSVKVLNRMDNIYLKKPFSYIYEFTNERITFQTLQSVLVGNAMSEFMSETTKLNTDGEHALLKTVLASMIYNFSVNQQNKVLFTQLNDPSADQELLVKYTNFISVNQQLIPHSVIMNSKAKNKAISLDLNYLKIDMDGNFDLPFRVPERFLIKN
jgi:hypothetical protein